MVIGHKEKTEYEKRLDKISELCEKDRSRIKYNLHESELERALNLFEDISLKRG